MTNFVESTLFVLAVILVVVVLPWMWLARRRRAERLRAREQEALFAHRLLHPDYAAFAAHYQCSPPAPLRQLYEDRDRVLDGDFEVPLPASRKPWFVAWFEPMEDGTWVDIDGLYAFANDGAGNLYLVDPRAADPEVIFIGHETGRRETLGVRLSQFLTANRARTKRR